MARARSNSVLKTSRVAWFASEVPEKKLFTVNDYCAWNNSIQSSVLPSKKKVIFCGKKKMPFFAGKKNAYLQWVTVVVALTGVDQSYHHRP
jgi:hypothetical protein